MASDAFLVEWVDTGEIETDRVTAYLHRIRNDFGYDSAFFVSSRSGTYYHADGVLKVMSPQDPHDIWYYAFVDSEKAYDLDVDTNQASDNRLTIFVNYRVEDSAGELLGVAGVGITMESFAQFLAEKQEKYDRFIYLADMDGIIQAHSEPEQVELSSMFDREGLGSIAASILRIRDTPIDSRYSSPTGTVLVTSRYMPEFDWFIIVEQEEYGMLSTPRRNLIRTLIVGLVTSIIILAASLFTVHYFQKRLRRMATTDELTGLTNRREFEVRLARCMYRLERYDAPVSIVLIDIDRFKDINDTAGHLMGDRVIKEITVAMELTIRETDVLARWGGDEFILLTESGLEPALRTAERIRSEVSQSGIDAKLHLQQRITLSCGVTEFARGDTIEDVVRRADEALYESKSGGRDTVTGRPAPEKKT